MIFDLSDGCEPLQLPGIGLTECNITISDFSYTCTFPKVTSVSVCMGCVVCGCVISFVWLPPLLPSQSPVPAPPTPLA